MWPCTSLRGARPLSLRARPPDRAAPTDRPPTAPDTEEEEPREDTHVTPHRQLKLTHEEHESIV